MKIERKTSGWSITDYDIKPIFENKTLISLAEIMNADLSQPTMDYILDTFRFYKGKVGTEWYAIINYDTIMILSIMENYPEYSNQLSEYFETDEWTEYYLRFGH